MTKQTIENFCEVRNCHAATITHADTMLEAIVAARKVGWSVAFHGSGHGWLAFCPAHLDQAPRS